MTFSEQWSRAMGPLSDAKAKQAAEAFEQAGLSVREVQRAVSSTEATVWLAADVWMTVSINDLKFRVYRRGGESAWYVGNDLEDVVTAAKNALAAS